MNSLRSIMAPAIQNLEDAVSDLRRTDYNAYQSILARFTSCLDEQPLSGFLLSVLPWTDFDAWWSQAQKTAESRGGSGTLIWPGDLAARVAMQVAFCGAISTDQSSILSSLHTFFRTGTRPSHEMNAFIEGLLNPLIRDIRRLAESRPISPHLLESMRHLPASGDSDLDALLQDACQKFKDPAPSARRDATEQLWDAWERLKSLNNPTDKSASVQKLLDSAADIQEFRDLLESEARALTGIGNNFRIRHHETNRFSLTRPEQHDYLFHRLYALMHFLLFNRGASNGKKNNKK